MNADDPSLLAFATDRGGANAGGSKVDHSDDDLIVATSRCPFRSADGTLLNVECFGPSREDDASSTEFPSCDGDGTDGTAGSAEEWPLLLYVHGICESAETWAVQILARRCAERRWRLVALELDGHGLSGGSRAVCGSFDVLVGHVSEFVEKVCCDYPKARGFVLAGSSMGAILVAYAAQGVRRNADDVPINNPQQKDCIEQRCRNFFGVAMLAPAVGIDPRAIPPRPVVEMLRAMSYLVPSWGFLTPVEDPALYACPPSSTRNFNGRWPLATAAMLLNLTSERVPEDLASGRLGLHGVPSLLVVAGTRDQIVPFEMVQKFYDVVNPMKKDLMVIKGAGHAFVHYPKSKYIEKLFSWLEKCEKENC